MVNPVLEVRQLTTKLQMGKQVHTVVDQFSCALYPGKVLALVGESGCGKSMTALSIMGILPTPPCLSPEGEVLFGGQNLLSLSEKRMRAIRGGEIAMIFQDPSGALNPVYTVGSQMVEAAELHLGLYGEDAEFRAIEALKEVGIPSPVDRMNEYPHQLSGGMRQRVMIAMALMCEPKVLIADEPTTALDVTIQAQVLDLIRALMQKHEMALLLITHDMGVVAEMADEVIVMYASQAVEEGPVAPIFDRMSHPYTMGLFASLGKPGEKGFHPIKGSVPPLGKYPKGCRFHPRCPFVMEKCCSGEVPFFEVEELRSRCWLHDGSEESREKWRERHATAS